VCDGKIFTDAISLIVKPLAGHAFTKIHFFRALYPKGAAQESGKNSTCPVFDILSDCHLGYNNVEVLIS
jgi:hypothetical protein